MKKWIIYLIVIILFVIGGIITYNVIKNKFEQKDKEIAALKVEVEYYKNAANPSGEVIDSLQYNIDYRDTVTYHIKSTVKLTNLFFSASEMLF